MKVYRISLSESDRLTESERQILLDLAKEEIDKKNKISHEYDNHDDIPEALKIAKEIKKYKDKKKDKQEQSKKGGN